LPSECRYGPLAESPSGLLRLLGICEGEVSWDVWRFICLPREVGPRHPPDSLDYAAGRCRVPRPLISGCGTSPTDRVFSWLRCFLVGGYQGHRPFPSTASPAYCSVGLADPGLRSGILVGGDVAFAPAHTGRRFWLVRWRRMLCVLALLSPCWTDGPCPVVTQFVSAVSFARVRLGTVPARPGRRT
jgi:hypothetical protein